MSCPVCMMPKGQCLTWAQRKAVEEANRLGIVFRAQMRLPYWVGPVRRGVDPQTKERAFLVDVAPSRKERKVKGKTVCLTISMIKGDPSKQLSAMIVEAAAGMSPTKN